MSSPAYALPATCTRDEAPRILAAVIAHAHRPVPTLADYVAPLDLSPAALDAHDYATPAPDLLARAFTPDPHDPDLLTPAPWLTDPAALVQVLAQHTRPDGAEYDTGRPCPTWCEHAEHAHPYTYTRPDTKPLRLLKAHPDDTTNEQAAGLYRIHRKRLGRNPTHVALEARDRIDNPHAPSDYGTDPDALTVALYVRGALYPTDPVAHLTPLGARELACQLNAAAALADTELAAFLPPPPPPDVLGRSSARSNVCDSVRR
ncbi:MAG: hypothetical protein V9G04_03855 [Nocardioides sp.]